MEQKKKRNTLLGLLVVGSLLASLALVSGLIGRGQTGFAQSAGVTAKDYAIASGQEPWGVTFDSKGNVWVAVPGCDPTPTCASTTPPGEIEVFSPASTSWIATYQLPAGFAQPLFLQFDASGNLWFPMPMVNSIGMLDPQTGAFQQFAVPTAAAGPWDLAIDHHGTIWFTEHYTNQIGELNPATDAITEYPTPSASSQPYGIVVDASNDVWFTENNPAVAQIGEYTAGGTVEEYKIRNSLPCCLTPHLITVDPNGNLWWTEGWVGMIGELQAAKAAPGTNQGVTEYAYPTSCSSCGTHTSGIAVDGYGQVWFDDSLQGVFGSFPDSGQGQFSMEQAPTPQHPHDGLNVDAHNRVWFTEEFANKLAVAVQNSPPPGATLAQDTFQRANQLYWGTASDGLKWGGQANSSGVFSIANHTGRLANGSSAYNAVLGPVATDAEVIASGSLSSFKYTNLGAVLRWKDGNDWYRAFLNGSHLVLQKRVKGTLTTLKTVSFTAVPGTSYTIDFRIVGTTLSANAWKTGTGEPTGWMATATDSSLSSGYCGLRIQLQSGVIATITSFQALTA